MDQQGRRGPGDQQRNPGGPAPGSKRRSPQIRGAALQWRGEGARGGRAEDAPPAAASQAPGAALFSSHPIHRSALSVSLPNCVDCNLCWWLASISRAGLYFPLDFSPLGLFPLASTLSRLGPHVWRLPHPIGRPGDAYGRLDDTFGARRAPYAVGQGEADAQVANCALSPRHRLGDALRTVITHARVRLVQWMV